MRAPSCYLTRNHITQIHCQISSRRKYNSYNFKVKISSMGHRRLVNIVKRNTKTDGMGPIKWKTIHIAEKT